MDTNLRKAVGTAWIKGKRKPFFSERMIRRGRFKGWLEVTYFHSSKKPDRKIKIRATDIVVHY